MRVSEISPAASSLETTLTSSGFALAGAVGFVPLGPVSGADVRLLSVELPVPVYRQPPFVSSRTDVEEFADDVLAVDVLDREVTAARHRAYGRLSEQAVRRGADAVIGIRLTDGSLLSPASMIDVVKIGAALRPGAHPYVARTLDYQLLGTAVKDERCRSASPELSNVSAADLWRLQQGGWRAVGVVGGCAHRFGASLWVGSAGHEIHGSTVVWTAAREAALAQLTDEIKQVGADGVIGIEMTAAHELCSWTERVDVLGRSGRSRRATVQRQGILVSISALGTAVQRARQSPEPGVAVTRTIDLR